MTANFKYQSIENMDALLKLQPNRPILVSEFWPGWFDHWLEPLHNTLNLQGTNSFIEYFMTSVFLVVHFHYWREKVLALALPNWTARFHSISGFEEILGNIFRYNASVNFYMFHGGTNFGFMNGANHIESPIGKDNKVVFPFYAPDVTSYGILDTNLILH